MDFYYDTAVVLSPGYWVGLTRATFTGDKTPLNTVDAGVKDGAFYLATGGETHSTRPLGSTLERPPGGMTLPDLAAPAQEKPQS